MKLSQALVAGSAQLVDARTPPYFISTGHPGMLLDPELFTDPLGAALLGALSPSNRARLWAMAASASDESFKDHILHVLHVEFPQLGRDVWTWPRLARAAGLRPPPHARPWEGYMSLWRLVTTLSRGGQTHADLAGWLAEYGL